MAGPTGMDLRRFKHARVLIVDDEPANVELLRRVLERAGLTKIAWTSDPRDAGPLYSSFRPDLIVLDLHMPHVSGLEVLDRLNEIAEATCDAPS